jgi:predicted nuclease with TOPRIM domain
MYLYDTGWYQKNRCIKRTLQIRPWQIEQIVFEAMQEKFKELIIKETEEQQQDTEMIELQTELVEVQNQLSDLVEQIPKANDTVMRYINEKIELLDGQKVEIEKKIERLTRKQSDVNVEVISEPMQYWDELTNVEKYNLAKTMIDVVYVSDEKGVEIVFGI